MSVFLFFAPRPFALVTGHSHIRSPTLLQNVLAKPLSQRFQFALFFFLNAINKRGSRFVVEIKHLEMIILLMIFFPDGRF